MFTNVAYCPVSPKRVLKEAVVYRDRGIWVPDKIAVVDIDGVLLNSSETSWMGSRENPVSVYMEKLQKAAGDQDVKAVVLRINSPGGTVGASDLMYHQIREFKRHTNKPVVAYIMDVGASGGYYVACGCDGIMAQPSCVTGSIGTIMQTMSFAGTMTLLGIRAEAIKSGDLKDMGSPLKDLRPEERKVLQELIMHFYGNFLDVVEKGRPKLSRAQIEQLADGRVYTAEQAKQNGLIDRIGYPPEAIRWAKELAGLKKVKAVMYHRPVSFKPTIYASAETSAAKPALINIELPRWLRSEGPQFMYLWQVGDISSD
jgi:protease IV